MDRILECALTRWNPQIGDPTLLGWVTVLVYGLAGLVAITVTLFAGSRQVFPAASRRRERLFWLCLGLLLLFLALNKQLDLQSFMTASGRCVAQLQGWYGSRRLVQAVFIVGLIFAMAGFGLAMVRMLRGTLIRNGMALAGMVFVMGFVLTRAVGFHYMDGLINTHVLSVRTNAVLELSGLILILIAGAHLLIRAGSGKVRD